MNRYKGLICMNAAKTGLFNYAFPSNEIQVSRLKNIVTKTEDR